MRHPAPAFWLAIVGLITVTAAGVSAQRVPLRFVSTAWPPFTNTPGQSRFALELVDEALKRIGESADTTIVDEAAFTTALLGNEFDGSAAAWKDADREKRLLYSEPYLENRLVLVGRRGSDVSAASFNALAGKRIAVVGGYSYGDAVTSRSGPIFIRSRGEEDSMAKLLANEVDYTLMDELVVQYLLDHYGEQARSRLQLGAHPLVIRTLHVTIRRERPDAASIIRRFNAELRKMVADRTYHKLLHVDWIAADVDGDGRVELISRTEQVGATPPSRAYDLFVATPKTAPKSDTEPRFYMGGNIYENWAAVPESFKNSNSNRPDPARSTASIFSFRF